MHVDTTPRPAPSAIVPRIFVPGADNTTLTLQWRANNGVAQLGLKGHDNKCDKLRSDAARKERKKERQNLKKKRENNKNFSSHSDVGVRSGVNIRPPETSRSTWH